MNASLTINSLAANSAVLRGMVLFVDQGGWPIGLDAAAIERVFLHEEIVASIELAQTPMDGFLGSATVEHRVLPYADLATVLGTTNPDGPRSAVVMRVRSGSRSVSVALATGSILNVARPPASARTPMPDRLTPTRPGIYGMAYTPDVLSAGGVTTSMPALQIDIDRLWSPATLRSVQQALRHQQQ